jgi:predicted AlkP superfamily phosphohydrolase/phosphomutase
MIRRPKSTGNRENMKLTRTRSLVLLATVAIVAVAAFSAVSQSKRPKVIVLGFDGVDARYTEQWMDEGELPNLARLREQGTFRHLTPTLPAQTPVSWSTFATGIDPGLTGIFDFLRRDPETYLPVFAAFDEITEPLFLGEKNKTVGGLVVTLFALLLFGLITRLVSGSKAVYAGAITLAVAAGVAGWWAVAKYVPETKPGVINRRAGIPMWEVAAEAGLKARVIRVPVTFPAMDFPGGHLLSGLGVPDMSGRIGKPFYFTSELNFSRDASNEFSIEVVQLVDNRGSMDTEIVGPPNKLFGDPPYIACPLRLTVADDRESVTFEVSGQTFTLKPGEWSEPTRLDFQFNELITVHGFSRFFLLESQPEVKIYLSPINIDPRALPPGFKITTPGSWAKDLAEEFGPYKTMGWAIDTWAISEGFANEQMFWDDMEWTVRKFAEMNADFLKSDDDLFIHIFEFPDRVAHVLWRLIDQDHPAYDPALAAQWGDGLLRSYRIMDEIIGKAMAAAEEQNAALIVLSDHGFATWRRSINYNTWLAQNGYLGVKAGVEAKERDLEVLFDHGEFWENVDWSQTKAYSLGLGNIYINLEGREAEGTVKPGEEAEALKLEIKEKLEAVIDPETGLNPVSRVVAREDIYREFDPNLIPDLFVTNNPGYRVAWQSSLGGIQKDLITMNRNVWSGDHCSVDPLHVKGIFFYNRKLTTDREPYIADIYPTVLDLLGVEPPYRLDGEVLD